MRIEDYILSAAMKLSHGENLETTLNSLHEEIKGSEDTLTRDLEACNWFDLNIPTEHLNRQPSQSLPAPEIDYSSLLQKAFDNVLRDSNTGGLASPPYSPNTFPSTSAIPELPCINPQLLDLGQLRLHEKIPDSNGRGKKDADEEDEDALEVKKLEEDGVHGNQEEDEREQPEDEGREEPHNKVDQRGMFSSDLLIIW